ncbi:MAG: hypothetical protein RL650_278 [Pseudomonadota bacterium]
MTSYPQSSSDASFSSVEDIREAMLKSVEGGEYHPRQKILETSTLPYTDYLSIGLALRECFLNPQKHEILIQRLRPLAGTIIGVLPPGIQNQGLLPKDEDLKLESFERKNLDQITDAQLRQWIVDDGSLVYGELTRHELNQYFNEIGPMLSSAGHFVDLGSGLGKVVMTAGLQFPFETCKGIEILPYRHKMAFDRFRNMLKVGQEGFNRLTTPTHADQLLGLTSSPDMKVAHLLNLPKRVSFQLGDMFTCDIGKATLVFLYSTCFGSFMHKIAHKLANEAPEGCLVSCTTYAITHPGLELVKRFPANTLAWTDVFIYRRVGSQQWATPPEPFSYLPNLDEWEAKARELLNAVA